MKEEIKKEEARVEETKETSTKKTKPTKNVKTEGTQQVNKVEDPYVAVVNAIVNTDDFRKAIVNMMNVRAILASKDLTKDAANACANIINTENTRITKVIDSILFNI